MSATLHTYLDRKDQARKMASFMRKRNVLSKINEIKRGAYRFTMIVPHIFDEKSARRLLHEAIGHAGSPFTEPAIWASIDDGCDFKSADLIDGEIKQEVRKAMTKLYEMTLTISIKVEADDIREARRECTKLAHQTVDGIVHTLPVGVSINTPISARPVNLI